jgi:CHAT domain-containing protein
MQIPLLSGREFTAHDNDKAPQVAIVNETLARRYVVKNDSLDKALGHILRLRLNVPIQIVGVVKDSSNGSVSEPPPPVFYLPNLQQESSRATIQLRTKGDPTAFTYDRAVKELVVTELKRGPQLVHFATHGFFRKGQTDFDSTMLGSRTDAAMLNSGLVLAGANTALPGEQSSTYGVRTTLTAFEISSLNLRRTELIVLSACDTGVNDTSAAGEVFGLRSAFQIAGASPVLMTMWSVPTGETQQIIEDFYRNWMSGGTNNKGMDKYDALRIAQLNARRVNPVPNSWGAFVLMGK